MISNANNLSGVAWQTSSFSGTNGQCVELGKGALDVVYVRDSKNPSGPALAFSAEAITSLLDAVKAGEFPAA